jgi:hypothetical protein
METALALHDLAEDHVVVEILERLTSPATALELHVVQDAETGATHAWRETMDGAWLALAEVGKA